MRYFCIVIALVAILSGIAQAIPSTAGSAVALAAAADGGVIVPPAGTCVATIVNMSPTPLCTSLSASPCATGIKICTSTTACAGIAISREVRANIFYATTGGNIRADDGGVTVEYQGPCK